MTDPLEVSREDLRAVTELEGKVAVDLGAGIGILSALAVRFGRLKEVHAVEALPEESAKVTVHCGFAEEVCDRPGWPGSGAALIVSDTWPKWAV
eukprot:g20969.t1